MHSALDDVEFLVRSSSRVEVLDAIHEGPRTRNELKEMTEISRFTLSRTLADFEDRGWIVRSGQRYESTGKGDLVTSEVNSLLANLEVAEELDGALDWLQTDQFGFDISCLRDAEVVTPTETDHTAPVRRAADLVREADRFRGIAALLGLNLFLFSGGRAYEYADLQRWLSDAGFPAVSYKPLRQSPGYSLVIARKPM